MQNLPPDYIAGFVDGEGCFALKFRRDVKQNRKNKPVYFYWDIEFAIVLRGDDRELLEKIQSTLDCGRISISKKGGEARYSVADTDSLNEKIVPFFLKHPLYGKKRFDFDLWKEAAEIFKRNQRTAINIPKTGKKGFSKMPWRSEDLTRLRAIHEEMRKYKSSVKEWKWL